MRERLGLVLLPHQVIATRLDTPDPLTLAVPDEAATPTALIDTAFAAIERLDVPDGTEVYCVISDRYALYCALPWSERMLLADEAQSAAREYLSALDAPLAATGELRLSDAPYGEPRLACALDASLLQALRERCAATHLTLRAVLPLLSACTVAASQRSTADALFVGVIEQHTLSYALALNQRWREVGTEWLAQPDAESVHAAHQRLRLRQPHWPEPLPTRHFDVAQGRFTDAAGTEAAWWPLVQSIT